MKLCNDTITVFNARVDPDVGGDVWMLTLIHGCSWYATDASAADADKGGLVAANRVTVRIPLDAAPEAFALKDGDIIVKGDATAATASGDGASPSPQGEGFWTPAKLKKAFGADCATVLAVTDNRRAPNAPHWRVTAT